MGIFREGVQLSFSNSKPQNLTFSKLCLCPVIIFTHRSVVTYGRTSQTRSVLSIALLSTYEPITLDKVLISWATNHIENTQKIGSPSNTVPKYFLPSGDIERPVMVSV